MESSTLLIISGVAVALLGVVWFAIRFWLASTRPVDIQDIQTPKLDQLNRQALENFAGPDDDDDSELDADTDSEIDGENEEAPEGLKGAVPDDAKKEN